MSESTIKALTEPINNLTTNCGHSDCKTKCGSCFELEIDTTHTQLTPYRPYNQEMKAEKVRI